MKPIFTTSMSYDGTTFSLLDQTLLPHKKVWIKVNNIETLLDAIHRLAVRGAPAIGISASIFLALSAEKGAQQAELFKKADRLQKIRPTAINLSNNLNRIRQAINGDDFPHSVTRTAEEIYEEDICLCRNIARHAATLIDAKDRILTHCNTGGLATAGEGTAMAILIEAHRLYGNIFIWVDETRPLLQGARLTAWECNENNIDHAVICDSAAAMLMAKGKVDKIFVGCDSIAVNGDFANKIGTYSLAVLAHHHDIPFYVVGPRTTVAQTCSTGNDIEIELRDEEEIRSITTDIGTHHLAPATSPAYNPAFDVTPARFVTAWILDSGIFTLQDIKRPQWWKR